MADTYGTEPHWRPENQAKVRARIAEIAAKTRTGRALDVGCGSGFLTTKLAEVFDQVDGIDITQDMLNRIDTSVGNIVLHTGEAESLPFDDNTFDFVGCYSFLHHLYEPNLVLAEMARVARPGGMIYADLEPNRAFWSAMADIEEHPDRYPYPLDPIAQRELDSVLHNHEAVEESHGIAADVFVSAEYSKSVTGGFDVTETFETLTNLGLVDVNVQPDWFAGQGVVTHEVSFEAAQIMSEHLSRLLPLSSPLFKYIWLTARKP